MTLKLERKHEKILASMYIFERDSHFIPTVERGWAYIVFEHDNHPGMKDLINAGLVKRMRNQAHKEGYLPRNVGSKYAYALTPKGRDIARTIPVADGVGYNTREVKIK